MDRSACLAELRRRIDRIERGQFDTRPADAVGLALERSSPMDLPGTDRPVIDPFRLGGGGEPALQELVAGAHGSQSSAQDFALALTASLLHRQSDSQARIAGRTMVLWCQRQRDIVEFGQLYGPGLRTLGLPPDRLLTVTGRRDADCLWAMEQGLASRSLLAVIGVVDRVSLTASRRLSLAARAHGSWCLLLPLRQRRDPSAARTRWRIEAASSIPDVFDPEGLGRPRWNLALERSENGSTGRWIVEWDHATHHFRLASSLVDRPVARRRGGPNDKAESGVIAFDRTG